MSFSSDGSNGNSSDYGDSDDELESSDIDLEADQNVEQELTEGEQNQRKRRHRRFLYRSKELRKLWSTLSHLEAEDLSSTLYNLYAIKRLQWQAYLPRSTSNDRALLHPEPRNKAKRTLTEDWADWRVNKRHVTAWPADSYKVPRAGERHTNQTWDLAAADDEHKTNEDDHAHLLQHSREWLKDELSSSALQYVRKCLSNTPPEATTQPTQVEDVRASQGSDESSNLLDTIVSAELGNERNDRALGSVPPGTPNLELDEEVCCEKLEPYVERVLQKSDQLLVKLRKLREKQFGKLYTPYYVTQSHANEELANEQGTNSGAAQLSESDPSDAEAMDTRGRTSRRKSESRTSASERSGSEHAETHLINDFRRRLIRHDLPDTITYNTFKQSLRNSTSLKRNLIERKRSNVRIDVAKINYRDYKTLPKLGLMGWKHLIGSAAGILDDAVLAKVKQRCEKLFGEKLHVYKLPPAGDSFLNGTRNEAAPIAESTYSDSELDTFQEWTTGTDLGALFTKNKDKANPDLPTLDFDPDTLICPLVDCGRHNKAYEIAWRLREHMKKAHGLLGIAKEIEPDFLDGVHRDGFLQPVPTWRHPAQKRILDESE